MKSEHWDAPVTHISDDRFREIVLSACDREAALAMLSLKESEHFHNCAVCIDRFGNTARQMFEEGLAVPTQIGSVAAEDGTVDTGNPAVSTFEGQAEDKT